MSFYKMYVQQRLNVPHQHRLQHVNECTVTPSLFQKGSAHCLLLRLLHQQVQVTDILHGAVQLGTQVTPAYARQNKGWRDTYKGREDGAKEERGEGGWVNIKKRWGGMKRDSEFEGWAIIMEVTLRKKSIYSERRMGKVKKWEMIRTQNDNFLCCC